jgi:Skp family chaperone for outer membrane proteins
MDITNQSRWHLSGWIVAAGLAGMMVAGGFQPAQEKTGVVDLNRMMQQSEFGKANQANINASLKARRELLEFVNTYRILTVEQAARLKELKLKAAPTQAERDEITRIENDVKASDRRRIELSQKQNLTEQDRQMLQDFASRSQAMMQTLDRWNNEFNEELGQISDQANQLTMERARAALSEVGKSQGFTVIIETRFAPYGANDVTEAALKAMNAKK